MYIMDTHAPTDVAEHLEPVMVGVAYRPPSQSVHTEYWYFLKDCDRNISTDDPFGAYAYLCVSQEIEVTPGTEKSNLYRSSSRRKLSKNDPKHAST
jgi:hypothetical protein